MAKEQKSANATFDVILQKLTLQKDRNAEITKSQEMQKFQP